MLKKAGLVAVATIGLSLAATPAFAAPATADHTTHHISAAAPKDDPNIQFADAFWAFIDGGADLGRGAAAIIAGAYAGIATTPALIAHSFSCSAGC